MQSHKKVGHVIVHLSVVQIRNAKPETRIFHERLNTWMGIQDESGSLLPLLCVGNHEVHMASRDFPNLFAGPGVYVGS